MDFTTAPDRKTLAAVEVRSYGQYCPIARASEILAMRWTPIIVRNLLLGCETFGEIQDGAPGIPRTLLSQRLRLLEQYGVVVREPNAGGRGSRYRLTPAGEELIEVCDAMGAWGARWLELAPAHMDAGAVLWAMCRLADPDDLPAARTVIRFDISDGPRPRFWVVLQKPASEVCVKPPGYDEDLRVHTSSEWLAKWHMGKITLAHAMHEGLIEVQGPRSLVRRLAHLGLSRYADVTPVA
jgi:DNA-binding HxlR family transcriptional regulator